MTVFLENCFGCLRLRTGVLIIGYLFLIFSLAVFIMHTTMIIVFFVTITNNFAKGAAAFVTVMSVLQMSVFTYALSTILLIYGATKGNRHLMIPFFSITLLQTAYFVFYQLLCCLFLVSQIVSMALSLLYVGVNIFVMYVILSHHQELKNHKLDNREDDEISIVNSA